jgi:hypothetical protein
MNRNTITGYAGTLILALMLGACSGSGSGSNPLAAGATGPVSVTITSPAAGETLETPDPAVTLAGTAGSNNEIVAVSWLSSQGEKGDATGTESWSTTAIPLALGPNTITVTAEDSAEQTGTRTIVVNREAGGTGSVTLSWQAPTAREDGSPLTDLSGYYIHYGRMSETYDYEIQIDNPGVLTYVVENLSSGTWYFVASAYDSAGVESNFSNEASYPVP